MVIGTCTIELHIPGSGSLKGKRRVIKSIIARVHNEFNVSIAEVDNQDLWQSAVLGVACVSIRRGAADAGANHWSQACGGWGVRIKNGGEKR